MSSYQRTKGANGEREIVNLLKSHDIPAKRISMMESGKCGFCGDTVPKGRSKYCSSNCIKMAWKSRNPEKVRLQHIRDNSKWKEYQKTFSAKNPGRIEEIKRDYHIKRYFCGVDLLRGDTSPSCYFCGNSVVKKLCMHHKDLNRGNNAVTNIEVLCFACHVKLHYLIGFARRDDVQNAEE